MPPISLSDDELAAVLAAARPLERGQRDGFLQAVAAELKARGPILGPGTVNSAIRAVQRRFFDPPDLSRHGVGKYD
jgi:hypothetical protein